MSPPTRYRSLGAALLVSAALLLAGCGGGSSNPGVAHLASGAPAGSGTTGGGQSPSPETSAATQQKMIALSRCMRSHGVPEFPEPSEGKLLIRGGDRNGHGPRINPESSRFQAALKACAKFAPNGGKPPSPAQQAKMQEQALKFSACMRSHGVPNFPDPEFHSSAGGVSVRLGSKRGGPGGIDPSSPKFQAAQKACQSMGFGPKGGPPHGGGAVGIGIGG